jgi:excisionase family DNA binding protein
MKVSSRARDHFSQSSHAEIRRRHLGLGHRATSLIQPQPRALSCLSRGLRRPHPATPLYSPTHYAPSDAVPGPHLGDPKGQKGPGAFVMVAQAGPPAADCGTAPPCGGRLYGGTAVPLTFGLWPNSWINPDPRIDLWSMKRNQPTDSGLTFDIKGMQRNAPPVAFFTERTLAAYLAVSDRTIRNWIRRGELPSYKLGAARRIDPADVDTFLAQRRELP